MDPTIEGTAYDQFDDACPKCGEPPRVLDAHIGHQEMPATSSSDRPPANPVTRTLQCRACGHIWIVNDPEKAA